VQLRGSRFATLEEIGERFDFGVQSLHPAILADNDGVFSSPSRAQSVDFPAAIMPHIIASFEADIWSGARESITGVTARMAGIAASPA
jgi:hypothetical protein